MTSCAMIAGMVPMALGLGEGGEQTAPLGRAVIGGLVAATLATLTVLADRLRAGPGLGRPGVGLARPRRPREPALTTKRKRDDSRAGPAVRPTASRKVLRAAGRRRRARAPTSDPALDPSR